MSDESQNRRSRKDWTSEELEEYLREMERSANDALARRQSERWNRYWAALEAEESASPLESTRRRRFTR